MIEQFDSMDGVLNSTCRDLLNYGQECAPRGCATLELLGYGFRLTNPRARKITIPARRWNEALAVGELCWHLRGSDRVDEVAYYASRWLSASPDGFRVQGSCYGKKIFASDLRGESQWLRLRRVLASDRMSRRAVLVLADDDIDPLSCDQSCVSTVQFLVRDERLHAIVSMRSNDIILGLCYDAYLLTMLQEMLALSLGYELGWYQHFAGSMHLYQSKRHVAEEIAGSIEPSCGQPMPPLSDLEALPGVLEVEKALRCNAVSASQRASELPPYWRELVRPLIALHKSRHAVAVCPAVDEALERVS